MVVVVDMFEVISAKRIQIEIKFESPKDFDHRGLLENEVCGCDADILCFLQTIKGVTIGLSLFGSQCDQQ